MEITIKAARVHAGITQKQAAAALNVSKSTYANYENYKTVPNIAMAKAMASLFGFSVNEIIFLQKNCALSKIEEGAYHERPLLF